MKLPKEFSGIAREVPWVLPTELVGKMLGEFRGMANGN